jgi:hypothetical protein
MIEFILREVNLTGTFCGFETSAEYKDTAGE